jgi:CobQ-like glutamine amidotransferase family enzyme
MTPLVFVHLYPRELGINGDVGNVLALRKRAEWRGLAVEVVDHAPGDALPETAHFVHIGSGPASSRAAVQDDVQRIAPDLRRWADAGVPFLAIAAGWQLLGRELTEVDGTSTPGAGVFPSVATLTDHRFVGEVSGESELGTVAGFENHSAVTTLDEGSSADQIRPLASLDRGHGKQTDEGVVAGDRVGTNLHGAFLPMNPHWADRLLDAAIRLAGVQPADIDSRMFDVDAEARRARDAIRARLGL